MNENNNDKDLTQIRVEHDQDITNKPEEKKIKENLTEQNESDTLQQETPIATPEEISIPTPQPKPKEKPKIEEQEQPKEKSKSKKKKNHNEELKKALEKRRKKIEG